MAPKAEGKGKEGKGGKDNKSSGKGKSSSWGYRDGEEDGRQSKGKGKKGGREDNYYDDGDWKSKGGKGGKGARDDGEEREKSLNSSAAAFQPSGMFGEYGGMGAQFWWQPMPPLWSEFKTEDGTQYYYNSRTGRTQWERPPELDPPKPAPPTEARKDYDEGKGRDNDRGRGGASRDTQDERRRDDRRKGDDDGDRRGGDKGKGKQRRDDGGGKGRGGGGKGKNQQQDPADFGPPGCNLFVFHLPDDWTDDDLNEYFSPHGPVISAKVMKELGTGRSRGFGFVSYEDRVGASTAIKKMQGYKILGKRLKVEFKKGEGDDLGPLQEDDDAKKSYPDDERLIGYLRAISAKNVVQSLKESENMGGSADKDDKDDADGGDDRGGGGDADEDRD